MDILVTGGGGQLGTALQRLQWPQGVSLHAPSRREMDLADPAALAAMVASRPWAAVVNCAAYTAVDRCESDVVAAWSVNALAPAALAAATAAAGVPILHVSTDYVFDGSKSGFYVESDPVGPLGVYGASKEGGEQAVRTANPRHVILRTAWIFGATGSNFVKTMLRHGAERPVLRVVDDQFGCPSGAADIAGAIQTIALRLAREADAPCGTWHFANGGDTSWHGFATGIFAQSKSRGGPASKVEAISTAQYPTPARRPANSRLSTRRLEHDFGIVPRPWRVALADVLRELLP